jgi:hypothetical protein
MALLDRNGYKYTGYTEPFITSIPVALGTDLTTPDYDGMGTGIVAIENTEFRNSGLYLRTFTETATTDTIQSRDCNFNLRQDSTFDVGKFVITDGTTYATVDAITYTAPIYGDVVDYPNQDDSEKGVYTLTLSVALDIIKGNAYRVVGRMPVVGSETASRDYTAGERIQELLAPISHP